MVLIGTCLSSTNAIDDYDDIDHETRKYSQNKNQNRYNDDDYKKYSKNDDIRESSKNDDVRKRYNGYNDHKGNNWTSTYEDVIIYINNALIALLRFGQVR